MDPVYKIVDPEYEIMDLVNRVVDPEDQFLNSTTANVALFN